MEEKKVTSIQEWKAGLGKPLELPSGNVCLARAVGLEAMIQAGVIPNSLIELIHKTLAKSIKSLQVETKPEELEIEDIDEQQLRDLESLYDRVLCYCVVEPKVELVPANEEDRDPNTLYADEVDLDDKLFIFQFASGGTRDLSKFRGEYTQMLATVSPSKVVERKTKSAAKRK